MRNYKVVLDEEELQAVVDFQTACADDAQDSCEYEEAARRRDRARELENMMKGKQR